MEASGHIEAHNWVGRNPAEDLLASHDSETAARRLLQTGRDRRSVAIPKGIPKAYWVWSVSGGEWRTRDLGVLTWNSVRV